MANSKNSKNNGGTNDGLALIVGGLFVLALVFATYSYFNRVDDIESEVSGVNSERTEEGNAQQEDLSLGERIKELFNSQKENQGDLNGEGASTGGPEMPQVAGDTEQMNLSQGSYWTANDYEQGDIAGNTYTVTEGDTLWEIAEARYGSGADWTKILDANSSEIGYLANGQQALIVPGQVLTLP